LVDENATERLASLLVLGEGREQLLFGDEAVLQQDVAQLLHALPSKLSCAREGLTGRGAARQ
jgi:hypothetical protein